MEKSMSPKQRSLRWSALAGAVILVASAAAQQPATEYKPQVGQPGKDVVWVPTPQALVDKMLDMAKATPQDYVVDLGSGDGRTVITAAKRGIKAHGIEYNPELAELAKRNAKAAGVTDKATFENADIFKTDFSNATVVTLFLLPGLNIKLRPILLDMKPGTRVVSNSFNMGDWEPDDTVSVADDCTSFCKAYLWIIPAKVEGKWKLGESELSIDQEYQTFKGTVKNGNVIAPIMQGKLNGDQIAFTAGDTQYTGTVKGNAMEGTSKAGSTEAKWQATRQ
jgi:Methyltransferase domain